MAGAGELDRRITIQRATVTRNEFNEPIESWGDLTTVWAKRRDASAAESYRAQEVGAEITTRFTIRWSMTAATVNPSDRVSFEGRLYNITAVRDVGRNQWREIDAVARAEASS
jgi:SPP1 family predicted phage head-tail adaptor